MRNKTKQSVKKTKRAKRSQTVGESIIQGLQEAIAWSKGKNDNVRVTLGLVPAVPQRPDTRFRSFGRQS